MTAKERDEIPTKYFGLPEKEMFPMPDANHVEAAERDLDRADITSEEKSKVEREIKKRKKQLGMEVKKSFISENDKSGLQKAIDQIGITPIAEKYYPKGMRVLQCQIHGAYMAHYTDPNPVCPTCMTITNCSEGNGTTATEMEHYIDLRDMCSPTMNPHN